MNESSRRLPSSMYVHDDSKNDWKEINIRVLFKQKWKNKKKLALTKPVAWNQKQHWEIREKNNTKLNTIFDGTIEIKIYRKLWTIKSQHKKKKLRKESIISLEISRNYKSLYSKKQKIKSTWIKIKTNKRTRLSIVSPNFLSAFFWM